jgi:hypothetical protein
MLQPQLPKAHVCVALQESTSVPSERPARETALCAKQVRRLIGMTRLPDWTVTVNWRSTKPDHLFQARSPLCMARRMLLIAPDANPGNTRRQARPRATFVRRTHTWQPGRRPHACPARKTRSRPAAALDFQTASACSDS